MMNEDWHTGDGVADRANRLRQRAVMRQVLADRSRSLSRPLAFATGTALYTPTRTVNFLAPAPPVSRQERRLCSVVSIASYLRGVRHAAAWAVHRTILGSKLPRSRRMPDQVAQVTHKWQE